MITVVKASSAWLEHHAEGAKLSQCTARECRTARAQMRSAGVWCTAPSSLPATRSSGQCRSGDRLQMGRRRLGAWWHWKCRRRTSLDWTCLRLFPRCWDHGEWRLWAGEGSRLLDIWCHRAPFPCKFFCLIGLQVGTIWGPRTKSWLPAETKQRVKIINTICTTQKDVPYPVFLRKVLVRQWVSDWGISQNMNSQTNFLKPYTTAISKTNARCK